MAICLDLQDFWVPPAAAGPKLASRGFRAQVRDPFATTSGVPSHPPLPQDMRDPESGDAGKSQVEVIWIPSDGESLGGLLSEARSTVQPGRVSGTGMSLDLAFLGQANILT